MGIPDVLLPHDCLRHESSPRPRPRTRPQPRPHREKVLSSSPYPDKTLSNRSARRSRIVENPPRRALVMEEVRILKRGEGTNLAEVLLSVLPAVPRQTEALEEEQIPPVDDYIIVDFSSVEPEWPVLDDPMFPSGMTVWAGTGFDLSSPPPSALPFPSFFFTREEVATRNICCLLRLDEF